MKTLRPIIYIPLIFLAIILSYLYVLNGDFIGDDLDRIVFNPEIRSYWDAITGRLKDRPLLMFIVTFISKVFGTQTVCYRLFSIFMHTLVAHQLYLFMLELNQKVQSQLKPQIAFFCGLLFALHPLNSQAITTAIQMSVIVTAYLGLVSLRYFFKGFTGLKNRYYLISLLCMLVAVLLKPNLFFIPIIFLIYHKKIKSDLKSKIFILVSYFAVFIIPAGIYVIGEVNNQITIISPFKYFLIQAEVIFTYIKLMFIPYNLQFLYDFDVPRDIWSATKNWAYLASHCCIIAFAYFKLPSRLLWGLFLCFYLSFLPESSFFPINHLAFEHRTYFSLIFFIMFFGSYAIHLNLNESFSRLIKIFGFAACVLFMILNQNRNVEIKRYGTWAYHALTHANHNDYHNYSFSFHLARAKNFELVEPIIRNYPKIHPDRDYEKLIDILEYFKNPDKKMEYINKFLNYLTDPNLRIVPRMFINKIVIEDYANNNDNLEELMRLEWVLAKQLPIIIYEKRGGLMIDAIRANYSNLARFLVAGDHRENFKKLDPVSYLRAKVFLQVYFEDKFDHLAQEIENELQKQPSKVILKDLLMLLNSKPK